MTDAELDDERRFLRELKEFLPAEAPKAIEGIVARSRSRTDGRARGGRG